MAIVETFLNDIFHRVATEGGRLARYNKRQTITSREVQTAVRLIFPGELAKHAVSEGTKAVVKYNHNVAAGTASEDDPEEAAAKADATNNEEEYPETSEEDDEGLQQNYAADGGDDDDE